jgi:hypothetical protein
MEALSRDAYEAMSDLATQMQLLVRAMAEDQPDGIRVPRVTAFAMAAMPGAEHASISVSERNKPPETIAATGELPLEVDRIQYDTGEGPSVEALIQSDLAFADDLETDTQWPKFAPRAVETAGVRSILSYRLYLTTDRRGALNFYAGKPQAFDQLAMGVGALFAAYASLTLLNEIHRDKAMHLERALESSREIGCAMGILMARELCTQDQAFDMLRNASQHTHRKLRDVADQVRETGALPDLRVEG